MRQKKLKIQANTLFVYRTGNKTLGRDRQHPVTTDPTTATITMITTTNGVFQH
jgi:hypothetical protein